MSSDIKGMDLLLSHPAAMPCASRVDTRLSLSVGRVASGKPSGLRHVRSQSINYPISPVWGTNITSHPSKIQMDPRHLNGSDIHIYVAGTACGSLGLAVDVAVSFCQAEFQQSGQQDAILEVYKSCLCWREHTDGRRRREQTYQLNGGLWAAATRGN